MSVGTAAMPQKEEKDQSVRLAGDVVRMARIVAAVEDSSMTDLISDTLRPILSKRLEQIQKDGLVPKPPRK